IEAPGILVVDDDPSVRALLGIVLRRQGFTAWVAADGLEALDLYRRHSAEIALVLLDVRMPVMDGPQTWAALQQVNPGVRCCFISGHTGKYTEQELLERGAVGKPFAPADLGRRLWRLATESLRCCA